MKNYYFKVCFIVVLCISTKKLNAQSNIIIDPNIEYQTIEGWGVSLAWWANLAGGMGQPTIDELAGYAVNDLNLNVFRFNIAGGENPNCTSGDHFRKDGAKIPGYRSEQLDNQGWGINDYTNDARQIAVMDKLASLRESKGDIITEMISYSPPWWMTYGECSAGNVNATSENLKPEFVDDFADYLVSVTAGLKTAHPLWNISYIEPFNEPISGYWSKGGSQEGSAIYEATQAQVLWRLWQSQSTYNVESLGLAAADNSKVTTALSNVTNLKNNNPGEYNGITKINTHSYGGSWQDKANLATFAKNNGNKPIWQTETGPLSWNLPAGQTDWWIRHYDMAYRLVEDLRNLQATVWCDWQLMSYDDGWGLVQQTNWDQNNPYKTPTLKKTRGFYCRKNVTNFIKVGYKIIDTDNGNTLAALSPNKNELVFVVVNSSNVLNDYAIDLNNFSTISGFKTYRTSGGDSSVENTTEKTISSTTEKGVLSGKTLSYTAPAYSVTTFVIPVTVSSTTANLANGLYEIKAKHSGKSMAVNGLSMSDGTNVVQWAHIDNQDNFKFLVEKVGNEYVIKPRFNEMLLTVEGQSTVNGAKIEQRSDYGSASQLFYLIPDGGGYYKIINKNSNLCMAVEGGSTGDGANIVQWQDLDTDNFKWEFVLVNPVLTIPNGEYFVNSVLSNKYMSVAGFSSNNGAIIEQWEYLNQDNLKFNITQDAAGYYKFKPKYNDKLITIDGGLSTNGTAINIYSDLNAINQKYNIVDIGNGQYKITTKSDSNKALAVTGTGLANGDDVVLWDYLGFDNFKWEFTSTGVAKSSKTKESESLEIEDVIESHKIRVYPNPNKGRFTIIKKDQEQLGLQIFDIFGRLLMDTVLNAAKTELNLDRQKFQQGVYLLKVSDGVKLYSNKIILK